MRPENVLRAAMALCVVSLAACSSGNTTGSSATPVPVPRAPYPAFTPTVPQLQRGPFAVMTSPVVKPIFYGEDPLRAAIDSALTIWTIDGRSNAIAALAEYGVRSVGLERSIDLAWKVPSKLSSQQLEAMIVAQLDGTHPVYGPVDAKTLASEIFVGFAPAGTEITFGDATACTDFAGYDAGVTLPSGAVAHYVVVPRCAPPLGVDQAEWLAKVAISNVLDRIGNPVPSLVPKASETGVFDPDHAGFGPGGSGLASACAPDLVGTDGATAVPVNGPLVPRIWSNVAAAGYHDPCVPAPLGPYFVSVPIAKDVVTLPTGEEGIGVLIPVGGSKTIDVQLLSDSPTDSWLVWTQLLDLGLPRGGTSGFTFTWDRSVGNDGDTLHLTITAPNPPRRDVLAIYSTRDSRRTFWMLPIESR